MSKPDSTMRDAIIAYLRKAYNNLCRQWFDDIELFELDGGTLKLLVKEPVQLKYLQRVGVGPFTEAAQAVTGRLMAVRFIGESDIAEERLHAQRSGMYTPPASSQNTLGIINEAHGAPISPDHSFANFVVGPENELAYAAATAVWQKPGKAYNPLYLHGGIGLGKTHLLQAICQARHRADPDFRIYYTSCNGFMTEFMEAVQQGEMSQFRHRFRNVDMLVIDDIHHLSNRDQTQEEFFHTFNALHQAGKQIVLSSDAAPSETPDMEERLTSRFACGLVARMGKPSYETRVAIVRSKAKLRQIDLPEEICTYVAGKVETNIRELEGAINKILAVADLHHCDITIDIAREALGENAGADGEVGPNPSVQDIMNKVTSFFGVKLADMLSKRRHKSIALPRQVCMYLTRKYTRYSLQEIGGYFGGRDHTTVMHAIRAIDSKREKDVSLDRAVNRLESMLADEP